MFWLDCDEPCGDENIILKPDQIYWKKGAIPQGLIGNLYPNKLLEITVNNMKKNG